MGDKVKVNVLNFDCQVNGKAVKYDLNKFDLKLSDETTVTVTYDGKPASEEARKCLWQLNDIVSGLTSRSSRRFFMD